jgi:hypothetical protein
VDLVPAKAVTLTAREQVEAVRTIASMKIAGAAPLRFPMGQGGIDNPVRLQTNVEN